MWWEIAADLAPARSAAAPRGCGAPPRRRAAGLRSLTVGRGPRVGGAGGGLARPPRARLSCAGEAGRRSQPAGKPSMRACASRAFLRQATSFSCSLALALAASPALTSACAGHARSSERARESTRGPCAITRDQPRWRGRRRRLLQLAPLHPQCLRRAAAAAADGRGRGAAEARARARRARHVAAATTATSTPASRPAAAAAGAEPRGARVRRGELSALRLVQRLERPQLRGLWGEGRRASSKSGRREPQELWERQMGRGPRAQGPALSTCCAAVSLSRSSVAVCFRSSAALPRACEPAD